MIRDNVLVGLAGAIEGAVSEWRWEQQFRYIRPVRPSNSQGLVKEASAQMRREFLLGPPLLLHSPVPEILTGLWCAFRESLVAGPASRGAREVIAQGVAELNQCPYCADVHSMMVDGVPKLDGAGKHEARGVREWAQATRTPGAQILQHSPFPARDAAQWIGTALVFHYLNRMVNVFLHESPLPSPSNRLARSLATSAFARRIVGVNAKPGGSLLLLPDAPIPPGFAWAKGNEFVAGAFARFSAVVETAGSATLPVEVRALAQRRLDAWNGEDPGLSNSWLDEELAEVRADERPAARLLLLTAMASYRVDDWVVAAFRERYPTDRDLISATAWASFAAMRRTASWLGGAQGAGYNEG